MTLPLRRRNDDRGPGRTIRSVGLLFLICAGVLNSFGAEPIELGPDSPGVKLLGSAKVEPLKGKVAEKAKDSGVTGNLISLGTWSKLNTDESAAEFVPNIPQDGYYDVYACWTSQALRGASARPLQWKILYDGGEISLGFIDLNRLQWVFLGTYPFKKGDTGKVLADAQNSRGASSVFGVRFVPVADPKKALAPRPPVLPGVPGSGDVFEKLRIRVAEQATASAEADLSNPQIAQAVVQESANTYLLWKSMLREDGQVNLWADLNIAMGKPIEKNEGGGWQLDRTFRRVAQMAGAYVRSNAERGFADKMQGNPELLKDILFALEWLYENRYNERSKNKYGGEWIGMEVGIPTSIATTLLLLYPEIPKDLMEREIATMEKQSPGPDKFYGDFPSTGFNLYNGIRAFVLRSILKKDGEALSRVANLLESEYQIASRSRPIVRGAGGAGEGGEAVEESTEDGGKPGKNKGGKKKGGKSESKSSADGYYADGSFIQHGNLPYIGIYGRGLLERFGQIRALLAGTPWEIKDPRADVFYDMVYRGYAPLFFDGEITYGSLGRSTGQSWHQNGTVSSEILNALVPMIDGAPPEDAARLKSVLRGWLLDKRDPAYPEFSRLDLNKITPSNFVALQQLLADETVQPEQPPIGTTFYHNTDYVVHHQPDFAAHLRMFSTRIRTHEDINEGTNRFGWYQGFGTLVIYNRDNSRFNDHFWATVNPYRLPGTTVDTRSREVPGSRNGDLSVNPWAGGVEVQGLSLASMDLADPGSSLTARKAWFFLNDQVVCLGAGIQSTDDRTIETIVENTKLHGGQKDYPLVVNGTLQPSEAGWTAVLPGIRWAHLGGKVPGTDLGWVFPGGADLTALRETRKGKWLDSFVKDADETEHERDFFTLWYDHGKNPDGKDYAYIILPGKSAEQVKAYADRPEVEIVENSTKVQAVRSASLGVTAVNFWEPGEAAGITSSGKAAVLIVEKDGRLEAGVADPTQLAESVEISLNRPVKGFDKVDSAIEVVTRSPLRLKVDLKNSEGRSITASFKL